MEYIINDEFQDIDALQYRLMDVLQGYHKNLFVVGNHDQTIYTWRGADVRFLLDFDKHYPGTHTVLMLENYRSVPQVLAASNSLNYRKTACASRRIWFPCAKRMALRCGTMRRQASRRPLDRARR
ncbi:MAG: UvrD-helicase domain-containing protein [Senegalimassilia faecalis]